MNSRALGARVLVASATGRAALLSAADAKALESAPPGHPVRQKLLALGIVPEDTGSGARAREIVESGLLNWSGPSEIVIVVSEKGGEAMTPAVAKSCVDVAFKTPRPSLAIELVDEDGRGWPAAWLAIEYGRRREEWAKRGLAITYRTPARPAGERTERLHAQRVAIRADLRVDGPPPKQGELFPAARARVLVGKGAKDPEGWADALGGAMMNGVRWLAAPGTDHAFVRAFAEKALVRMIETSETSDLRDEQVVALLAGRPWEIPGLDLFQTLACAPDGRVFTSELGFRLSGGGDETFLLGDASTMKFQDLPTRPIVPALAAASANVTQPLCAQCVYRSGCAVPPSVHWREQGSLTGRLPDSPACLSRLALLDAVFSRLDDEKCLKALQKWGVDTARFTC